MTILSLVDGDLSIRVGAQGGVIIDGYYQDQPIFRPYPDAKTTAINPLKCASFPLVPFGNRVESNVFVFESHRYHLSPNTDWDTHYLHGDGWLSQWSIIESNARLAIMQLDYSDENYSYRTTQTFSLDDGAFSITMSVENRGTRPMPFGIGHHLFFPLTPQSKMMAPARQYWTEKHYFLPDQCLEIPSRLNFLSPSSIPREWINNGFEGWDGRATMYWPENGIALHVLCDTLFNRYYLFHSDKTFEPDFKGNYFCFEPMSHSANGHNLASGGLRRLAPRERFGGRCTFRPVTIASL